MSAERNKQKIAEVPNYQKAKTRQMTGNGFGKLLENKPNKTVQIAHKREARAAFTGCCSLDKLLWVQKLPARAGFEHTSRVID